MQIKALQEELNELELDMNRVETSQYLFEEEIESLKHSIRQLKRKVT